MVVLVAALETTASSAASSDIRGSPSGSPSTGGRAATRADDHPPSDAAGGGGGGGPTLRLCMNGLRRAVAGARLGYAPPRVLLSLTGTLSATSIVAGAWMDGWMGASMYAH